MNKITFCTFELKSELRPCRMSFIFFVGVKASTHDNTIPYNLETKLELMLSNLKHSMIPAETKQYFV